MRIGRWAVIASAIIAVLGSTTIQSAQAATSMHCSVSGPVPAKRLLSKYFGSKTFVGFSAVQHGMWIGIALDLDASERPSFDVISYRRGHSVHVLMRTGRYFAWDPTANVQPIGVRPNGTVIVNVRRPHDSSVTDVYALRSGHRVKLKTRRSWRSVKALAVTDSGRIIGVGLSRSWPYAQVVTWRYATAAPQPVSGVPNYASIANAVVDRRGDIVWITKDDITVVRLASGQIRALADPDAPANWRPGYGQNVALGQGHFVWSNAGMKGMLRWDLARVPASGPLYGQVVAPKTPNAYPAAASVSGVYIDGNYGGYRILRDPEDRYHTLRHEFDADGGALEAIDHTNLVAFTSSKDHLPHFLSCA